MGLVLSQCFEDTGGPGIEDGVGMDQIQQSQTIDSMSGTQPVQNGQMPIPDTQASTSTPAEPPKTYSWDKKRGNNNPNDFKFDGLVDEIVGKYPGSINGQQFLIQNCKNCHIYIFDWTASVTVDDCVNCKIMIGPCKGSIFIRDSVDCNLLGICQQFRTRDCRNLNIFLHCTTQPIIEASTQLRFACLQLNYAGLKAQYENSGLSVFNNFWGKIHDFTPVTDSSNYSILAENANPLAAVPFVDTDTFICPKVNTDTSLIPMTWEYRRKTFQELCFLLLFSAEDGQPPDEAAFDFIDHIKHQGLEIKRTKQVTMTTSDAERLIESKAYNAIVEKGPVIALEVTGPSCRITLATILGDLPVPYLMPEDGPPTDEMIYKFYAFSEMKMGM